MLTVKEAAQRSSVSESLVYAWCNDGTLPHTRVGRKGKRGHIRITVEDLDGVMASLKITGSCSEPESSLNSRHNSPKQVRVGGA